MLFRSLREILAEAGAEEFGPILAMRGITSKQIVYLKDKDLVEVKSNLFLCFLTFTIIIDYTMKIQILTIT